MMAMGAHSEILSHIPCMTLSSLELKGARCPDQETQQVLTACLYAVQTKGRYHVRVLVPCYRESLEIVARTSQAAWNARLPAGCDRTIYLCDDGKDPLKRKW